MLNFKFDVSNLKFQLNYQILNFESDISNLKFQISNLKFHSAYLLPPNHFLYSPNVNLPAHALLAQLMSCPNTGSKFLDRCKSQALIEAHGAFVSRRNRERYGVEAAEPKSL